MSEDVPQILHMVTGEPAPGWPFQIKPDETIQFGSKLTDVYDTVRFPATQDFPVTMFFEDALDLVHEITVTSAYDTPIKVAVPIPANVASHMGKPCRFLVWEGTDLQERTKVHNRSDIAICTFSYTHSLNYRRKRRTGLALLRAHGIRIHVRAYDVEGDLDAYWAVVMASAWTETLFSARDYCYTAETELSMVSRGNSLEDALEVAVARRRKRTNTDTAAGGSAHPLRVHLALLLAQFCWGSAAVVNKLGLTGVGENPILFALIREVTAAPLLMLMIATVRGSVFPWSGWSPASPLVIDKAVESRRTRSTSLMDVGGKRDFSMRISPSVAIAAAIAYKRFAMRFVPGVFIFIDQFCSLTGVKFATPTSAAAWQPSQVIFTMIISVAIGSETFTFRKICGGVFVLMGAAYLIVEAGAAPSRSLVHPVIGQSLFCISSLASSLEIFLWRHLLQESRSPLGHIAVMAESYIMASLLMAVAFALASHWPAAGAFLCPECQGDPWQLHGQAMWAIGYSVIFQTVIGYCVQAWALRYAQPSTVALYAVTQPVFATCISCALILVGVDPNGALSWPGPEMFGAVLMIVGLLVAVLGDSGGNRELRQEPSLSSPLRTI